MTSPKNPPFSLLGDLSALDVQSIAKRTERKAGK